MRLGKPTERAWHAALACSAVLHVALIFLLAAATFDRRGFSPRDAVDSRWSEAAANEVDRVAIELTPSEVLETSQIAAANPRSLAARTIVSDALAIDPQSQSLPIHHILDSTGSRSAADASGESAARGDGAADVAEMIGIGEGTGHGLFGVEPTGRRIVYVVDCSRSMNRPHASEARTRFKRVQLELLRAIDSMTDEHQFFIVFFNQWAIPMPAASLQSAATRSRQRYLHWMATMRADGDTDPREALAMALRLRPDDIVLLTDGDFGPVIRRDLKTLTQREIAIHTIAFDSREGESLLKELASRNNGQYRYVP